MGKELLSQADIRINGSRAWDIQLHHAGFFKRVLQQGSLGLGESYMEGWWDCERLDILFCKILKAKLDQQMPGNLKDILRIASARLFNLQSRSRAWIVGKEHYDIGNDLFALMLDPHMQYSCAYWKDATTLDDAQNAKLKMICEKLQLKPGMRLLDIGCGWGGLAEYAARHYGVAVEGVTISKEQQKMAQQRCEGLDVKILLQDYRDLDKHYDRIVSVLHTIGSNKKGMSVDPWINKYIFPNGCLPAISHIAEASESRFVMEDWHNFGSDYDKTLMAWHERFNQAWPELSSRYSATFRRMFNYYLCACAGAFRARDIELWQVLFSRGVEGGIRVYR